MAASAQRLIPLCKMSLALILIASLLNGAVAQEEGVTMKPEDYVRGDMIPKPTQATDAGQEQVEIFPSPEPIAETTAAPHDPTAPEGATDEVTTERPKAETPAPARGDGPADKPKPPPKEDVVCVPKEAVQDKNAVSLKLKSNSNCEDTKKKIQKVLEQLCGEDCKLQLYQENDSDQILVAGDYVESDVRLMAKKFNNDNIKDKTDVEEAVPRWGKSSKLVLVSVLLAGLLLAALLVAGYYLKTHRKNSKGVRLAESFQVDEENQANTLVSVAPLHQEHLDKPTVNGSEVKLGSATRSLTRLSGKALATNSNTANSSNRAFSHDN